MIPISKLNHHLRESVSLASTRDSYTTPKIPGRKHTNVETSHDTEVAQSALQRSPERRVKIRVCVDHVPVRKDELEVGDIVATQTVKAGVVRITTASQEAADAYVAVSTAGYADLVLHKLEVDIGPT